MYDDLPDDVLAELGRIALASIDLDDCIDSLCSEIEPSNPRDDRRSVAQKMADARKVLRGYGDTAQVRLITAWLDKARHALTTRNAVLHSTPLVHLDFDWTKPHAQRIIGHSLAEYPRLDRPYTVRALTVDGLHPVLVELSEVEARWRETYMLASALREPID